MDLFEVLSTLKTSGNIKAFMKDLCTPKELLVMEERWKVCQLLAQGDLSYREIHKITGASLTTIGRVSRFLKEEDNHGYKLVLQRAAK